MDLMPILIAVTSGCCAGFIFLLVWIMKMNTQIEKRATYGWCEEQLVKKEVLDVTLKSIEEAIERIETSLKKLTNNAT